MMNNRLPIDKKHDANIDIFQRVIEDPRFIELANEKIREQECQQPNQEQPK